MSKSFPVVYAPEFIQRAFDWAECDLVVTDADGQGNFEVMTVEGDDNLNSLAGKLISTIVGLYIRYRDDPGALDA